MNYLTKILALMLLCSFQLSAVAQANMTSNQKYKALKVGDKAPDYTFINLINFPSKTAKLSDFRGKLLILDFWSTNCGACIASWPKLLNLQKEFDGKMQIVLVNPLQNKSLVEQAYSKRKNHIGLDMNLPTICGDSTILQLFPVDGIPHLVWIDETGIIVSITDDGAFNAKNINSILNKEALNTPQKASNSEFISYDASKPIFIGKNGESISNPKNVMWYSILTKGVEMLWPYFSIEARPKAGYFAIAAEVSISDLYRLAFGDKTWTMFSNVVQPLLYNRLSLKVKDKNMYLREVDGELQPQNIYNYQLLCPPTTQENIQKFMQADLKKYFGLNVKWETQKKKCFVLKAEDTSLISYKSGKLLNLLDPYNYVKLNKVPFSYFIEHLEDDVAEFIHSPYPIVDETGFKGLLGDFIIEDTDIGNVELLNRGLQKYKMRFTIEDRMVKVLVVTGE